MPKVRVFRSLPKAGSSPGKRQTRVIEMPTTMPLPMGAIVLDDNDITETSNWTDVDSSLDNLNTEETI